MQPPPVTRARTTGPFRFRSVEEAQRKAQADTLRRESISQKHAEWAARRTKELAPRRITPTSPSTRPRASTGGIATMPRGWKPPPGSISASSGSTVGASEPARAVVVNPPSQTTQTPPVPVSSFDPSNPDNPISRSSDPLPGFMEMGRLVQTRRRRKLESILSTPPGSVTDLSDLERMYRDRSLSREYGPDADAGRGQENMG